MSERLVINVGDEKYEMTPDNCVLVRYRKVGDAGIRACMYDHVLLITEPPIYAWIDNYGEEHADSVEQAMREGGYITMLNMPEVEENIIEAYDETVIRPQFNDLDEEVENWRRLFKNESEEGEVS